MKRNPLYFLFAFAVVFLLSSCSGVPGGNTCTVNCGGGTANLTLTLFDAPRAGANFLSFNTPVTGITLSPSSGADVSVFAPASPVSFDITRLQSDSAIIGTFQVPAGTYTKMNVFLGTTSSVFANTTGSTVGNCSANSVCNLNSGTPGSVPITFTTPLTLSGSTNVGLGIEFNLNNAVTTQNGITIDFNQPNILTVVALPRTGQASGTLDTIEDFTGMITTISGSNITITSAARGTLTAATTSSTVYSSLPTVCGGAASANCLGVNKTVTVDAAVSTSGVVTLTEVDFLDDPSVDEIEGTIYPTTTPNVYGLIVSDKIVTSGNALLTPVSSGATISVTLSSSPQFLVDARNLVASVPAGFSSSSDIFGGQTVLIHVSSATTGSVLSVTTDRLVLRYTRTTGTVTTVGGTAFTLTNLPAFIDPNNVPAQVQTFAGITTFDGVSDLSGLNGVTTPVSIRALFLNPNTVPFPFLAAKVRKH